MKSSILITLILITSSLAVAEDLGVQGKTYQIAEPDMIEWIKTKAKSMMDNGQWNQIQQKTIATVKEQINNPPPITGITDAVQTKTWYYTPMVNVDHDIKDPRGYVIAKAGRYNALRYKPMDVQLIFINGDNKKQVEWALQKNNESETRTKIILTRGSFMNLDKEHKVWFYYDQGGKYTQKLNIAHVPALVIQDGSQLKITEINNAEI